MEITVGQILNSEEPIKRLIGNELPAKLSYWLARNLSKMSSELIAAQETRAKIYKKYGVEDEKRPGYFALSPENFEVGNKELSELFSQKQEIDVKPIDIEMLSWKEVDKKTGQSIENTVNISVSDMIAMDFLFCGG